MTFNPTRKIDAVPEAFPHLSEGTLFSPRGFISLWYAGNFTSVRLPVGADVTPFKPDLVTVFDGSTGIAYFKNRDKGREANAALNPENFANEVWRLTTPVKELQNIDPSKFDRSPTLAYDVQINGLRSANRHTYQLYALPSIVAAVARYVGISVPDVGENPLLQLTVQDLVFDEALERKMVGNPKAGVDDAEHWSHSELAKWRARLWQALGESDVNKSLSQKSGGDAKLITTSEMLDYCLDYAGTSWSRPLWARIISVPDVRLSAVSKKSDKRLNIACVWELFESKDAAAKQAALEKRPSEDAGSDELGATGEPAIPSQWNGIEDEWRGAVATALHDTPERSDADIASELAVAPVYVKRWREYLN